MTPTPAMKGRACRNFYKFHPLCLFLALAIIILLLYRSNMVHLRSFGLTEFQSKVDVDVTSEMRNPSNVSTEPHKTNIVCSFHPLSSKEVTDVDLLRDSVAWPETPPLPPTFSLNDTSDPAHSSFTILPQKGGDGWHTGGELRIWIRICDFHGQPKKSGGDVLLARLYSHGLQAGVAGKVTDHLNGSYSAVFSLLWEGSTQVEVILVHPSEAVTVLQKLTQEQPNRIYFNSLFRSGSVTESTTCNVCLDAPQQKLCNYTDLHTGEQWFCYKPQTLDCDNRVTHAKGGFRKTLKAMEEKLFQRGVNMKVSIQASGPANITVLKKPKVNTSSDRPVGNGDNVKTGPTGYYYQGAWRALDGSTVHQFKNSSSKSRCLKGKVLHLYGDSTVRQWFEYLSRSLSGLKEFDLKSSKQSGPRMALDFPNNILVTYRCHGPPIRFGSVPVGELRYIANELDNVLGGSDSVVVIGVWSHFSTFPMEVYIQRMLNIRKAVVRLLARAPGTLVVIRTANPKDLTLYEAVTNSDWYSLQNDKILRAIFKGVNVRLVDAWEMVLAHNLPHSLHPQPPIIKNMIDVLLSYICPAAES